MLSVSAITFLSAIGACSSSDRHPPLAGQLAAPDGGSDPAATQDGSAAPLDSGTTTSPDAGAITGTLWSVNPFAMNGENVIGMVASDSGDLIYTTEDHVTLTTQAITRAAMADGKTVYRYPVSGKYTQNMAVAPDGTLAVVVSDGVGGATILCLDPAGKRLWETAVPIDNTRRIAFGAGNALWTRSGMIDTAGNFTLVEPSTDPMWTTVDFDSTPDFVAIRGATTGASPVTSFRGLTPTRTQKWDRPYTVACPTCQYLFTMRAGRDDTTYLRIASAAADGAAAAYDFGCGSSVGPSGFVALSSTGTCLWQRTEASSKQDPVTVDLAPEGLLVAHADQLELLAQATGKTVTTFSLPGVALFAASAKTPAIYAFGVDGSQTPYLSRIR